MKITSIDRILSLRQSMQSYSTSKIIYESRGQDNKVILCKLNKPKALNALDEEMIINLKSKIAQWENDQVAAVVLSGMGGKALCAGGDVKSLYYAKTNPSQQCPSSMLQTFFYNEYETDYRLATMKPILIALMDGIVMGGGVGISVHAPVRIATEFSVFAMPETKLGLFTDVGGGYFLSRLRQNLGMFIGLTGYRLKGADLYHAGLADYYVSRDKINQLTEEISDKIKQQGQLDEIKHIVSKYHNDDVINYSYHIYQKLKIPSFSLQNDELKAINEIFTDDSFDQLMKNIQNNSQQQFAKKQMKIIYQSCPISIRVTHEQIRRGKTLDLKENLKMDYRIVERFMQGQDFFEGIRSVLIDKEYQPQWTQQDAQTISQEEIQKYFEPLDRELDI